MKGVITDFIENKGFGFITDENYKERFFHISYIPQKKTFLENIFDYYYSDFEDRKCYIVNFTPSQNEKGFVAKNILLTSQVFNEKLPGTVINGVVTKVEYKIHSVTRIVQGIKKGQPAPIFATAGGNGTYRLGYPEQTKGLLIHFNRSDDIGWGIMDVRAAALSINNRAKITENFVDTLAHQLTGERVNITNKNDEWVLHDESKLII